MATVIPTIVRDNENMVTFTYTPMANGDDGSPIPPIWSEYSDRSIDATSTMGVGGSLTAQWSNTGVTTEYRAATDTTGTAIALTVTNTGKQITEVSKFLRPKVTAGDGTTAITATITIRRPRSGRNIA
jgi:hypothetical protein